jgi:hypothetical protein
MGPGLVDVMLHEQSSCNNTQDPPPITLQPKKGVKQGVDVEVEKAEDKSDQLTTPENFKIPQVPKNPRFGVKTTKSRKKHGKPCQLKFQESDPEEAELTQLFDPTKKLEFQDSDPEDQELGKPISPQTPLVEIKERKLWNKIETPPPPAEETPRTSTPKEEKETELATPLTPIPAPRKKEEAPYPNFEELTPEKEQTTEQARSVNSRPGTPVSRYQAKLSLFKEGESTEV